MKEHHDRVFIEGLHLVGTHGVLEHERHLEQEFVLDIEALHDSRKAGKSDKIADAVDYVHFRNIARRVITESSHYLIETIAERIAAEILEDKRISEVSVTVRKPAVLPSGVPGIQIRRTRK